MSRHATAPFSIALLLGLVLAACGPETTATRNQLEQQQEHVVPAAADVHDIMHAKLAHVHAVLEGVATQDYGQVAVNAEALQRLSEQSAWRVHTVVSYTVLCDEFGDLAGRLASSARAQDDDAIGADYLALTESCLACHRFLRREGLYRDMPGAVSRAR